MRKTLPTTSSPSPCLRCLRHFSTTSLRPSGHNRWSTIKHDKGKADAVKGKQRALVSKEISDASKMAGPDPGINARLADAITKAKRMGFPKGGIETAIARGQGKSTSGAALENVTIEAVIPPVAMIVECETDSKARALQDIRSILKGAGAQATPTAYLFEKRGRIVFERKEGVGVDEVLDTALEAGAVDVIEDEDGRIIIDTETSALKETENALSKSYGLQPITSDTIWLPIPETMASGVDAESLVQLSKLQEELQDYPGTQAVYMNTDSSSLSVENTSVA